MNLVAYADAPCHNEERNIGRLIDALFEAYDAYIHEIIIVDDNSTDDTAAVVAESDGLLPAGEPHSRRVPERRRARPARRLCRRNGQIHPDDGLRLRAAGARTAGLFDGVAAGREGAIGSRFSYESVLINYPFFKILCNRAFHLLVNLTLLGGVRDVSNNLKLYRADILKTLDIEEPHFAANMETGLKPLLAGYDVEEVPVSWINRTVGMGASSFRIVKVAPGYFGALMRTIWRVWRGRRDFSKPPAPVHAPGDPVDVAR